MTVDSHVHQIDVVLSPASNAVSAEDLEELTLELKQEIEQSGTAGISVSETQKRNSGALGPEWLPVLAAILSAPVAVEATKGLVKIISDWLRRRKPVTITVVGPKGEYVIQGENMSGEEIAKVAAKIV